MKLLEVCGLVEHYVIKNSAGEYLKDVLDTPIWTPFYDQAWKFGSIVGFHDADQYGGTVYAVIEREYKRRYTI